MNNYGDKFMEMNWYALKKKYRPLIEDLEDGERYFVELETEYDIYYTDCFKRYCYFLKSEEGSLFRYIRKGKLNG